MSTSRRVGGSCSTGVVGWRHGSRRTARSRAASRARRAPTRLRGCRRCGSALPSRRRAWRGRTRRWRRWRRRRGRPHEAVGAAARRGAAAGGGRLRRGPDAGAPAVSPRNGHALCDLGAGRRVEGMFAPARRRDAPAVVLMHEIRGGPDQWVPLLEDLREAGFAALAYSSRPSIVESERLPDAIGALRWLRGRRGVDGRRLGLVGASIGASTAVLAMAGEGGGLAKA